MAFLYSLSLMPGGSSYCFIPESELILTPMAPGDRSGPSA
jgi:hypothetical protein